MGTPTDLYSGTPQQKARLSPLSTSPTLHLSLRLLPRSAFHPPNSLTRWRASYKVLTYQCRVHDNSAVFISFDLKFGYYTEERHWYMIPSALSLKVTWHFQKRKVFVPRKNMVNFCQVSTFKKCCLILWTTLVQRLGFLPSKQTARVRLPDVVFFFIFFFSIFLFFTLQTICTLTYCWWRVFQ